MCFNSVDSDEIPMRPSNQDLHCLPFLFCLRPYLEQCFSPDSKMKVVHFESSGMWGICVTCICSIMYHFNVYLFIFIYLFIFFNVFKISLALSAGDRVATSLGKGG